MKLFAVAFIFFFFSLSSLAVDNKNPINDLNLLDHPPSGTVDLTPKPSFSEVFKSQQILAIQQQAPSDDSGIDPSKSDVLSKLDQAVASGAYSFISAFIAHNLLNPKVVEWTLRRAQGGDVLLMWELSDVYAKNNSIDLAIQWAYAALLGTMQERSLCLDPQVEYAAQQISSAHQRTIEMRRANPFITKDAKIFAITTLRLAKNYPDPVLWLCQPYSNPKRTASRKPLAYDAIYFPVLRSRARNKIRAAMSIDDPQETTPSVPPPPAK